MPTYPTLGHADINVWPSLLYLAGVFSLLPLLLPELVPAEPLHSVHSVTLFGKSEEHDFVILTFLHPFISCLLGTSCYSVLWKYDTDISLVLSRSYI